MTDQKHRNAYKRWWRNQKNYDRHMQAAAEALGRAGRSKLRMYSAFSDMIEDEDNYLKEYSK